MEKNYFRERNGDKTEVTENESGLQPVEDKVLILPDQVTEKIGTLYRPERAIAQEQMAQVRGLLVSMGGNCFEDWDGPIPQIGDRIMVCKYAGIQNIPGADGRSYQLCTDRDITAILTAEIPEEVVTPRKSMFKAEQEKGRIIT